MKVVIVKYNAGNSRSVSYALKRIGVDSIITDDPELITSADKVIFPGVGEAGSTMQYLREHQLDTLLLSVRQPFLGICLGLQLMCRHSEEGDTEGLSIFSEPVKKFPDSDTFKIPHMGWNSLTSSKGLLFRNIPPEEHFYFAHSFYAEIGNDTSATGDYILPFSAAMERDNYFAVQFHPEKSSIAGEKLLLNFLAL